MLKPTHRTKMHEVHAVQYLISMGDNLPFDGPLKEAVTEMDMPIIDGFWYWIDVARHNCGCMCDEDWKEAYVPIFPDPKDEAIRELARVYAMLLRGLPDNDYARSLSANPIALAAIEAARKERA